MPFQPKIFTSFRPVSNLPMHRSNNPKNPILYWWLNKQPKCSSTWNNFTSKNSQPSSRASKKWQNKANLLSKILTILKFKSISTMTILRNGSKRFNKLHLLSKKSKMSSLLSKKKPPTLPNSKIFLMWKGRKGDDTNHKV